MFDKGPQREVVSIYKDDFTTPASRPQYFIQVYRCVKVDVSECRSGPSGYPVPKTTAEIEIVVPDITNSKKFYKHVVYNHTSCKCGKLEERTKKLYKTITNNEVRETYFKANYKKNPVNLMRVCNVCNSAQPRHQLNPYHAEVTPPFKYLAYKQCLPGSVAIEKNTSKVQITLTSNNEKSVTLINDISCKAYDGENAGRRQCLNPTTQHSPSPTTQNRRNSTTQNSPKTAGLTGDSGDGNQRDQEVNYEILVYIASGKVILAAFLLSLVLFTILIMDFTLCRRKKGFLYALFACKSDDTDHFYQRCSERNRNEITV
ncbi:Hypothetical predicted protein [Paramuricea clavata]|uniref:Uncharacterized protein n=1 Tax=Paramuricea clavata TaxID=317549 RepID=A0A6S7G2K5_PARCT|nr:Hypothetical predicted protein [Paramuricea clavata]